MKTILLISALVSSSAFAAQNGGFTGPSAVTVNTVQVALDAKDDTPVTLTGYIVASLGDEEYQFKDATGEMIIEIDSRDWNGIKATPETKLVIHGEVDADWSNTSVEVNTVQLAH